MEQNRQPTAAHAQARQSDWVSRRWGARALPFHTLGLHARHVYAGSEGPGPPRLSDVLGLALRVACVNLQHPESSLWTVDSMDWAPVQDDDDDRFAAAGGQRLRPRGSVRAASHLSPLVRLVNGDVRRRIDRD